MAEGMGGFPDAEAVSGELGLHFLQQEVMGKREPRFRAGRGFHMGERSPVDDFGPAMEEKSFTEYGRGNERSRCRFRHDVSLLEVDRLSGIFQRQDVPSREGDSLSLITLERDIQTRSLNFTLTPLQHKYLKTPFYHRNLFQLHNQQ